MHKIHVFDPHQSNKPSTPTKILQDSSLDRCISGWKNLMRFFSMILIVGGAELMLLGYLIDVLVIGELGIASSLAGYIVAGLGAVIQCILHSPKSITLVQFCLNILRAFLDSILFSFVLNLLILVCPFFYLWLLFFEF